MEATLKGNVILGSHGSENDADALRPNAPIWKNVPSARLIDRKLVKATLVVVAILLAVALAESAAITFTAKSIPEQVGIAAESLWLDAAFSQDDDALKPDPESGYAYNTLGQTKRVAYKKICEATWLCRPSVTFSGLSIDDAFDIYTQMRLDHPELFHLGDSPEARCVTRKSLATNGVVTLFPEYVAGSADVIEMRGNLCQRVSAITSELPSTDDASHKASVLCSKLCSDVRYEEYGIGAMSAGHSSFDALCVGTAVCEGYALAYALLCNSAGLDCHVIVGDVAQNDDPNLAHAWCEVNIDGEWLTVDPTFSDAGSNFATGPLDQSAAAKRGYVPFKGNILPSRSA